MTFCRFWPRWFFAGEAGKGREVVVGLGEGRFLALFVLLASLFPTSPQGNMKRPAPRNMG